jgi:hypothetical protein
MAVGATKSSAPRKLAADARAPAVAAAVNRRRKVVTALALGMLLVGSGSRAAISAPAASGVEGIPAHRHVVILVLENEDEPTAFGPNSPARYLRSLLSQGAFDDQYYATGHASLDNYIAMTSGQAANPLTAGDCIPVNLHTCAQAQLAMSHGRNIADQLDEAGLSWKQYSEGAPSPCFHAGYGPTAGPDPYQGAGASPPPASPDYTDRHDPFLYYPDVVGDDMRCSRHILPYGQLAVDLASDRLPTYSFITPDTCHDGHDNPCSGRTTGGLAVADAWLAGNVPPLLRYLRSRDGLLVITFDEGALTSTDGCCTGGPAGGHGFGGRVGLLALGAGVATRTLHSPYDHASLLRTTEDALGITEHLNNASTARPMSDLFQGAGATP